MGRRGRRAPWRLTAVVLVLAGTTVAAIPVGAQPPVVSAPRHAHSTKVQPLVDHLGHVLNASVTYTLWWGPPGSWPSAVQPGIHDFLTGLNGSPFLHIAAQYMRGQALSTTYGGTWSDTSPPPSKVSASIIAAEVANAISHGAFGGAPDTSAAYLVYTSNFPKGGGYCAWHSGATVLGAAVSIAYLPNTQGVAGCADPTPAGFVQDPVLASLANDTSHELMESITDPLITAWYDQAGREIGDKCETSYNGTTTLGSTTWYLQEEWSNATNSCVMSG